VAALRTPLEVERLAREELGYVRPGEQAFVVMAPTPEQRPRSDAPRPTLEAGQASGGSIATVASDRGVLFKMWDYVTGRDLAGSG
jgi:hypothetical protein